MSEAWVLIAIAPVLYLLSMNGHRGLRFLMFAFLFLVIGDGLLSAVLVRSIKVSAKLPATADVDSLVEVPVAIRWPIGGPIIAHFTDGLSSEKAGGPTDIQGSLPSTAPRRGPVDEVTITVAAGAFLGLIGFVTESTIAPPTSMLALPRAVAHPDVVSYLQSITTPTEPDLIGVRPYRPGDRPADVHWQSVARTSEIMVRERALMPFEPPPLTIVATNPVATRLDDTLGLARFAVEQAWRAGVQVTLVTHQADETATPPMERRRALPHQATARPAPKLTHHELTGLSDLHHALAHAVPGPKPSLDIDGARLVIDDRSVAVS